MLYRTNNFKPTTGQQYEVGIKYQPIGWNALFTLAAFNLTEQNALTPDPVHVGFGVQTGQVRTRGIELSAVTSLTKQLSLQSSYSYIAPEVTRDNSGLAGNDLANVPRSLAKLWADYKVHSGALAGVGFGGGVRYIGTRFANTTNVNEIPDTTLFDVALRYDFSSFDSRLKAWSLSVNSANLADKAYVSDCSNLNCRWGQGRTVYGTVDYHW